MPSLRALKFLPVAIALALLHLGLCSGARLKEGRVCLRVGAARHFIHTPAAMKKVLPHSAPEDQPGAPS